jgi:hypothetical protein
LAIVSDSGWAGKYSARESKYDHSMSVIYTKRFKVLADGKFQAGYMGIIDAG